MRTLGDEIPTRRQARNISRERLGELLGGAHRDTVGAWERNEASPTHYGPALREILGIDEDRFAELLGATRLARNKANGDPSGWVFASPRLPTLFDGAGSRVSSSVV